MDSHPRAGKIGLVVFDWAGTTVDYGCFAPATVFVEVFSSHGIRITTSQAREPMGMDKRDHIRAILQMEPVSRLWRDTYGRQWTEQDIDGLFADFRDLEIGVITRYSGLIPGTRETVAWLRERGIKVGSTTGYFREIMDVLLPHAAKLGYAPDVAVCSTDVPAGRPAPWMVYQNMMQAGVYPPSVVVKVGDTVADVLEGLNAGVWSVGVTKTGNAVGLSEQDMAQLSEPELATKVKAAEKRLSEAGAHYVIDSVEKVPETIETIEKRLQQGERP